MSLESPLGGDLPAGLGDPLHLLEPSNVDTWLPSLLATLLGLLLTWAWRRWKAKRSQKPAPTTTRPRPVAAGASGSVLDEVAALRRRHARSRTFREGCHALASTLRQHLERARDSGAGDPGAPIPTLTAREMAARLGDPLIGSLFELLEELQFRRREPRKTDFLGVCDLATEVLAGRDEGKPS
jgi:hypothetical protein